MPIASYHNMAMMHPAQLPSIHHHHSISVTVTPIALAHPIESHQSRNAFVSSSLLSSNNLVAQQELNPDEANNKIASTLTQLTSPQSKPLNDVVKRVVDSSTIQLAANGYVTLDTVRGAGSTYAMPECMDKAPAYKLRGLLTKGTRVKVYYSNSTKNNGRGSSSSDSSGPKRVWLVRSNDDLVINRELVKTGYAYVRKGGTGNNKQIISDNIINDLNELEQNARRKGLGIFKICSAASDSSNKQSTLQKIADPNNDDADSSNSNFVAEFEPLEYTTQTQWGDDGGRTILVPKEEDNEGGATPLNPGDTKGCSDFETYEDALSWYERYFPYYGDVARLDRKGTGVPCSGLPHTKNMERYRMKRPMMKNNPNL